MPSHAPIDLRTEHFPEFMSDYPYASDVDGADDLPLQEFVTADDGKPFEARVLGFGSSYVAETHMNHEPGEPLPRGKSCSKCRWTDTAILWSPAKEHYVFVSLGKSRMPGEKQFDTIIWTQDPKEVLRRMFVPTKAEFTRDKGAKAIPPHNAVAFREAACVDDALANLLWQYEKLIPNPDPDRIDADPLAEL